MTNSGTINAESFLAEGLRLLDLAPGCEPGGLSRLAVYFQELKKWNRKINLVARSMSDRQILENHFLDSLTLLALLPAENRSRETILDIGTGAGFPGLVLKAACPSLDVTMVEPRKNRYYFLKHVTRALDLAGVEILNIRLEERGGSRELEGRRYSFVTSRALTDSCQFIILAAPYLEKGGRIILMRGPGTAPELKEPGRPGSGSEFVVAESKRLYLPFSKAERLLVSIRRSDGRAVEPSATRQAPA